MHFFVWHDIVVITNKKGGVILFILKYILIIVEGGHACNWNLLVWYDVLTVV